MKKYEVHFNMKLMSSFSVEVDSSNKEEAELKAHNMIVAGELDNIIEEAVKEADVDEDSIEVYTEDKVIVEYIIDKDMEKYEEQLEKENNEY